MNLSYPAWGSAWRQFGRLLDMTSSIWLYMCKTINARAVFLAPKHLLFSGLELHSWSHEWSWRPGRRREREQAWSGERGTGMSGVHCAQHREMYIPVLNERLASYIHVNSGRAVRIRPLELTWALFRHQTIRDAIQLLTWAIPTTVLVSVLPRLCPLNCNTQLQSTQSDVWRGSISTVLQAVQWRILPCRKRASGTMVWDPSHLRQ